MSFSGVRALTQSLEYDGATWTQWIYKSTGPSSYGLNRWGDLSQGAGVPRYNAYVGNQFEATALSGSSNNGIYTGPATPAGQTKHLTNILLQSSSASIAPALFVLCDYLLFYALFDGDDDTLQPTVATDSLPRYTDGDGVMCFAVATLPMVSNTQCTVSYTNHAGVSGRTSTFAILSSQVAGGICSSSNTTTAAGSASPFIPLASGDRGVRSIEGVTFAGGAGGFVCFVLVKPLATISVRETNTAAEVSYLKDRATLPRIYDGAFLNFIYFNPNNGTAAPLRAGLTFAWR